MLRPGLTAVIVIAMLAWAGHSLARLFWMFYSPQTPAVAVSALPTPAALAPSSRQPDSIDIAFLQENFRLGNGQGASIQSAGNGDALQAANTRLSLVLRGSIAGTTPADSSAIIASGERQQVYSVGDQLAFTTPGVTLDSVHPRYVVLNNNGRLETLWMYEPAATASVPAVDGDVTSVPAPSAPAAENGGRVQIRLYRENGTVRGLQIREDSDAAMLAAAGLQAGDIITSVDGVAINQSNDLSALTRDLESRDLESRDQVRLELIRNNTTMTVTVDRDAFAF